jgi:REP element-mobilizing transposase RayT
MPRARKTLVSLDATPYYHCVSRCVRRAFLCGEDALTGQSFEHRRAWIEDRMLSLAQHFALDICAYAVMSNHYHVVLFVDKDSADNWADMDVIQHWHQLFKGNLLSQRLVQGEELSKPEQQVLSECVQLWRERLMDISWYMRCLNEYIARQANQEDNCTGRFWEGRFKSQALVDEKALAACMTYVDLNPIRAKLATTPEDSHYTSVHRRIKTAINTEVPNRINQQDKHLHPFVGNPRQDMPRGLPFRLTDYLELVDWTGRQIRAGKRGAIAENIPPLLERLNIDTRHWQYLTQNFESPFKSIVGCAHKVRETCQKLNLKWTHGVRDCERLFSSG